MAIIPNVQLSVQAGGVGIIIPGVGPLPVNVAGWCSAGPAASPTPIGVGAIPVLTSSFGVGPAVELAAAILAQGAPQGVIVTRIYDGSIAATFTPSSGSAWVTAGYGLGSSPLAPYGNATATGSTGPIVLINSSGNNGVGTFSVSLNAGVSWSAPQLIPTSTYVIPNTNITLTFATEDYTAGVTYTGPITTTLGASYTILNGVNTEIVSGLPSVQQVPAPGASIVGGGVVTMDTTNNPQDAYNVVLLITSSGVLGVGQFSYSIDGGLTFSGAIQIPSGGGPTTIGSTGIAVDWANSNTTAQYEWIDSTDTNTVTFLAGSSFLGELGNNLKVVVATGSSLSNSIATVGNITTVTITIDTTVTTPALLATYVNTTAAATLSPYISISAHTGTTAFTVFLSATALSGGIGGGGSTSGFQEGESYLFTTVPPAITNDDILLVGEAITGSPYQWDWMHVVGRPTTSAGAQPSIAAGTAIFSTMNTIGTYWFTNQRYSFLVQDQVPATFQNNVDAALISAYLNLFSDYVSVGAGDANLTSAITGSQVQRCASWAASIWGSTLDIGTDLAEVALGSLPFVTEILEDQNVTPALGENGFTALRTINQVPGFFINNAFIHSNPATSDITYWQSRRVLNQACRIAYAALVTYLSKPILVNSTTGTITPSAATAIQNFVMRELNAGLTGQVSGTACIVNTTNDILETETLEVTIGVIPLAYPKLITALIGYVDPAISTQ